MTISTNIDIELMAYEVDTVEQIIETLQYVAPNWSVEDCLKWLFARGCNDFIITMMGMGYGHCPEDASQTQPLDQ